MVYGGILLYVSNLALVSDLFVLDDLYSTFTNTYGNIVFWFVLAGILVLTSLIDYAYNIYLKLTDRVNL